MPPQGARAPGKANLKVGGKAGRVLALTALCLSYLEARKRVLAQAEKGGLRIGPKWLGLLAWRFLNSFSELVGVRMASEGGAGLKLLDPARRYLIVWHPHGFLAWTPLFIVSRMAVVAHPHGREWFAMVAPVLFRIPIVAEALMLVNGRQVNKKVVENLAAKGKSLAIQPGGVREQIVTRHDQEQAVFPANLGFIRMALKHGMDLLPIYIFNENQMFRRVEGLDGLTKWVHKSSGFGMPVITGKFGLPMAGLLPRATEVHVRWGRPIPVDAVAEPSEELVEELFCRYLAELRALFDCHAHECLPPEVAVRGLKIVRLDGKPVPPHLDVSGQPQSSDDQVAQARSQPQPVLLASRL